MSKATNERPVLVTGNAGFIGFHVARRLLESRCPVVGIDNVNDYYDTGLKESRLELLDRTCSKTGTPYHFHRFDLAEQQAVTEVFKTHRPVRVIHLAAQPGVRYASKNPHAYIDSNVAGTLHVLEACRHHPVEHLVFASTSSIYGANTRLPYSEHQSTEHPLSLYAATKKSCEMMAHAYAHLYRIPATGLRFFTVYGPWGRPDMAPILFARAIDREEPFEVFNYGEHTRSFTFIDDIVEGMIRILDQPPEPSPDWDSKQPDPACSGIAPYRIYNIGHEQPVELLDFIRALEAQLGKRARMNMKPLQPGDVPDTAADVGELIEATGYRPGVSMEEGVAQFVEWYRSYCG